MALDKSIGGFMEEFQKAEAKSMGIIDDSIGDGADSDVSDYILRSTGFAREKDQENLKTLALVNPAEYSKTKQIAMRGVEDSVKAAYTSTYKTMVQAGMSEDDSKDKAKKEAMRVKEAQMDQFRIRFPTADQQIYQNQVVHKSKRYV
jgi:hypothetical protein